MSLFFLITIFILACFLGYFTILGVTPVLHSPLMSVSNAISGIVIVGALFSAAYSDNFSLSQTFSIIAVFLAAINIFGGFAISERMLAMFNPKDKKDGK